MKMLTLFPLGGIGLFTLRRALRGFGAEGPRVFSGSEGF